MWLQLHLTLQTKEGKAAEAMTADEFEDIMWEIAEILDDHKEAVGLQRTEHWQLSMDNDSSHTAADLVGLNIWQRENIQELPALSPDCHKVVEHIHGWIGQKHHAWRRSLAPAKPSPKQCMDKLVELFYSYPVSAIQSNVESLPETYRAIIHAAGMYPPKAFR